MLLSSDHSRRTGSWTKRGMPVSHSLQRHLGIGLMAVSEVYYNIEVRGDGLQLQLVKHCSQGNRPKPNVHEENVGGTEHRVNLTWKWAREASFRSQLSMERNSIATRNYCPWSSKALGTIQQTRCARCCLALSPSLLLSGLRPAEYLSRGG